ncbi:MAG: two component transcriptional regulator, winged helix family [Candidatus Taylorbacteria bacterium]|nr:two component transcriptional regulator, winged helix family [Candidatus Taylorbacteria bacterium]
MKLLIIEDDIAAAAFMKTSFESASHVVDLAHNGTDGSYAARINPYDVIILDFSMPKKNGLKVCEEIRSAGKTVPILFLSVIGDTAKKVDALEKGADDYMTKPFSFDELHARVRALARRPHKIETSILTAGDLSLNTERQVAVRGGTAIYLTRKEYTLLEYLMRNQGTILSRGMIMEHVWNADSDPFSNTIEAHILNLRKKVNIGRRKDFIRNVPGRGYMIAVE